MPSPSAVFSELVSTTWRNHRSKVEEAITNNNALLKRLTSKGRKKKVNGGLTIVQPIEYAENQTYQRFSGYDLLNVGASDVITSVEYPWRQIAIVVTANGQELRLSSGDSQIVALVAQRIENAKRSFKNNFSYDMYSDGTLPNQITGLQALVSDTGTGTLGGIDSNTWTFWRNAVQSAAAPLQGGAAITVGPSTMESLWLPLWMELSEGDDKPDLIVCSNNYFQHYENSQLSLKRYTSADEGKGGFVSMKYKTADVIYDGGSGIPDSHAYFLNTDYIQLCVHPEADLTQMDSRTPVQQDASVTPMLWMGNLITTNRRRQGVQKA